MRFSPILFLSIITFSLFSCTDDYFKFDKFGVDDINPEIAIPLINSSLSAEDIFLSNEVGNDILPTPDGFVVLIYESGDFFIRPADIFQLKSQKGIEQLALTNSEIGQFTGNGSIMKSLNTNFVFDNGNANRTDSVILKGGDMNFSLKSTLKHSGMMTITFPSILKNNQALSFTIPINYKGNIPVNTKEKIDLNEYTIVTTNANEIEVNYNLNLNYSGEAISSNDKIDINFSLDSMEFKAFYGDAGKQNFNFSEDSFEVKLFKNAKNGDIFIAEPKLIITTKNSMGIPISINFNQFNANTIKQGKIAIQLIQNPLLIASPSRAGITTTSQFIMDANNSNIETAVSALPKYFEYEFKGVSNPNSNNSSNFILDTSQAKLNVQIELPLKGTLNNYLILDTLDFELDSTNALNSAIFRTYVNNAFPIDADLQIYFLDENYNKIDSLYNQRTIVIPSSSIDANGRTTNSTKQTIDTPVNKSRLQKITDSKYALIDARLATKNKGQTIVKFYNDYRLNIKVGVKAQLNLEL